jgi:uncharacterized protein YndB with AHSA1/START domain
MIDVEATTVIDRPVEAVFAFVADLENNPKWESNFIQVERVSPEPLGVGTVYRCVLRVPGQRVTSRVEITEFVPNQRISFRGDQPASAKPVGSITFEPHGNGTRVTTLPRPEMRGIFKLLEPMMAGYIKRSNAKHLHNLKTLLES